MDLQLLSIREVAELTGLPRARVYELTRAGTLRPVRIGRTIRISRGELARFIEAGGHGLNRGHEGGV